MSDDLEPKLNKVISDDCKAEGRQRPYSELFDTTLVKALYDACVDEVGNSDEALCVFRRFLTLHHGMTIGRVDALFDQTGLTAAKTTDPVETTQKEMVTA